jgi:small GTP-binding protein
MELIKIMFIGPHLSGKTSLINKFINNNYNILNSQITIGCDFYHKKYMFANIEYNLHIWDTAGDYKYVNSNMLNIITKINCDKIIIILREYDILLMDEYINIGLKYVSKDNMIIVINNNSFDYNYNYYKNINLLFININNIYDINYLFDFILNTITNKQKTPVIRNKNKCSIL